MYPQPLTPKKIRESGAWISVDCHACRARPGAPCLNTSDTKLGVRGSPRPPHPARVQTAIVEDEYRRCREWDLSPEGVAHAACREALAAKANKRMAARAAHAAVLESRKAAAKIAHRAAAKAKRQEMRADGMLMRERVLAALIRIGGEGSAWAVATELGLQHTVLEAVHAGLLACVKRGDASREIVPSFVPSHRFSGGTSSVYRVTAP